MDHHVYFWLKDEHNNAVDRKIFEQGMSALFNIDIVAGGRWAIPAKVMERPNVDQSWDYALTMHFKSLEDHDAYQKHEEHEVFIGSYKKWWAQVQIKDLA